MSDKHHVLRPSPNCSHDDEEQRMKYLKLTSVSLFKLFMPLCFCLFPFFSCITGHNTKGNHSTPKIFLVNRLSNVGACHTSLTLTVWHRRTCLRSVTRITWHILDTSIPCNGFSAICFFSFLFQFFFQHLLLVVYRLFYLHFPRSYYK